jgi:hypothetical protein
MTLSSVKMFLLNLGARFVVSLFQDLEHVNPVQYDKINRSRGNMFDEIFQGIFTLSLERGLYSQATFSQMRPCQSHAIVILRSFEFLWIILRQLTRIKHSYGDHYVDDMEWELQAFEDKIRKRSRFQTDFVDNTDDRTSTFQYNRKYFQLSTNLSKACLNG